MLYDSQKPLLAATEVETEKRKEWERRIDIPELPGDDAMLPCDLPGEEDGGQIIGPTTHD
jgi:hypothetical protein